MNSQNDYPFHANWGNYLLRSKGNIPISGIILLAFLGVMPLIMSFSRLLTDPGLSLNTIDGFELLRSFGFFLNQYFSLEWVPPDDHWTILYLLLLPTAAIIITLARLTFGLRILGFRSVLIAVGFQEIGIIPSLVLIGIVVGIIVAIRPVMRNIRLPLYARVSVILCISVIVMVAALFIGPWLRSEVVWNVAFFPIIILAMLAEGVAKTMDRESKLSGVWRLVWTILVALIITWISQIPLVRYTVLHFPELILTQLVLVIFISEYFDFRILQNFGSSIVGINKDKQSNVPAHAKVAVVRNRWNTGIIGRIGNPVSNKSRVQSVQRVVDALRDEGYFVKVLEADTSLLRELKEYFSPQPRDGAPGGIVLNLAKGIQGNGRNSHLPAMLEMSGVAYTGPDPISHMRIIDRYVLLSLLQQAHIPVPRFKLVTNIYEDIGDLQLPVAIRPRCEPDVDWRIARTQRDYYILANEVLGEYGGELIVEEFHSGTEFRVSLMGNDKIKILPLLQTNQRGNKRVCPAPIESELSEKIKHNAFKAYRQVGCRDYARIDVRLNSSGEPCVVQIHTIGILSRKGSFFTSAEVAGYSFQVLMREIIELTWQRYGVGTLHKNNNVNHLAIFNKRTAIN